MDFLKSLHEYLTGEGWFVTGITIMIILDLMGRVLIKKEWREIDVKEGLTSIVIGLIYLFVGITLAAFLTEPIYSIALEYRLWSFPNVWWASVLAVLLAEFTYYWGHRWLHEVRLFWCIHMVHNSARDLSVATALKMPMLEPLFMSLTFIWTLPYLGFSNVDALVTSGFFLLFDAFHHTTVIPKLGKWDKYIPFVTPAQHRVHHGSDLKYLDKNYGGLLIIWDWVFGTFLDEEEEPTFDMTKNIDSYNSIYLQTVGFQ